MNKSEQQENKSKRVDSNKPQALLYDAPLRLPSQDRLGRAEFARFLARAILQMDADEGFVFALNGPWGSGKTSIINFVLHFLEQEQQIQSQLLVVRFNPWWFSGREQLLQQFFRQFRASLGKQDVPEHLKKVGRNLDRFASILGPLTIIPTVGGWINRIKDLFRVSASATKTIAEALAKDIHEVRASIDLTLRVQKSRILVVIDDIDRLPAEEIQQVFQVVKAVADFPKTIYLLAFDRDKIIQVLDNLQSATGEDYLEKIIQAQFDLPHPDRVSLRRLLFEQLDEVLSGTPEELWDSVEWGNLYWDGINRFIQTPRDIKRYINILRPAYPTVKGDVNPIDFFGIQALRLFAPECYDFVANNKDLLTGAEDSWSGSRTRPEERRKPFEILLETISQEKRETVKNLMGRLFPRWASAFTNISYTSSFLSGWRKKLRVCSPDIFERYFMFSLLPGDICSAEMRTILSAGNNTEKFGSELLRLAGEERPDGTSRLRVFIDRLLDFTEKDIPEDHIEPILRAIYNVGDQLFLENDKLGMSDVGNDMRLMRISYQLLKRFPTHQQRFEILNRIFKEAKSVSLIIHDISIICQEHREQEEGKPGISTDERTVDAEHLPELRSIGLQKIRDAMHENSLHMAPDFGYLLYRLSEWGSVEEAKGYVKQLISDDKGLCDYLSGFFQVTHSFGIEDRVSRRRFRVHVPSVQQFIDVPVADLVPRCQRIIKDSPEWFNDRKRQALNTFIQEIIEPKDEWGRPRKETP